MLHHRLHTLLRISLVVSLLLAAVLAAVPAQAADTYSVSGNTILKNGSVFVAKGANVQGRNWVWPRSITTATGAGGLTDPDLIANIWKFNLVRVNNRVSAPAGSFSDNNDLDAIVNAYTSRGVVVMLATHDISPGSYYSTTSSPTLDQWVTFWRDTALRYKNNPAVWFDVQNEPGGNSRDPQWVTTNQRVIQAIRDTAGANNIIVIEDTAFGQGAGNYDSAFTAANSAVINDGGQLLSFGGKSYGNIAFSNHIYEQWGFEGAFASDAKLASYIDVVRNRGYALIIGEYGLQNNDAITSHATRSMYNVIATRNVGRVVWHWYGGDGRNSLVNQAYESNPWGGWKIDRTDGTKPTNLSYLGDRVWYDTHNLQWPGDSDLIVTDLRVQQTSWSVGSTINFQVTVRNQGVSTAQPAYLNTEVFVDGQYVGYAAGNVSLAPGASTTATSTGWTATKASFSLQANIDTQRRFYESNESNNSTSVSIGGGAPPVGAIPNGEYKIIARHSGKALDVSGASTADGAETIQWTYGGSSNQRWLVESVGNGEYKIIARHSGKALDVYGASNANGGQVVQWTYAGAAHQRWRIEAVTGGYYRIVAVHSGKALDVAGASTADGAKVKQYTINGGTNQQWSLSAP